MLTGGNRDGGRPSRQESLSFKTEFEHLRAIYDERIAFMTAAIDLDFRKRRTTGMEPLEAYAKTVAEVAKVNALVEGYSEAEASERERTVYEKTKREGIYDLAYPHCERVWPGSSKSLPGALE